MSKENNTNKKQSVPAVLLHKHTKLLQRFKKSS